MLEARPLRCLLAPAALVLLTVLTVLALLAVTPLPCHAAGDAKGENPVEVFAELDGTWEGTFTGYDRQGNELYRIQVRQTYRTVDATTQSVDLADTMESGEVITGKGTNKAVRREDGSLALECTVVKSNGETVRHEGTLGKTPDGQPQIVWHSQGEDRWETFRETVRETCEGPVYTIDGVGRYGDSVIMMAGRYKKVADPDP